MLLLLRLTNAGGMVEFRSRLAPPTGGLRVSQELEPF